MRKRPDEKSLREIDSLFEKAKTDPDNAPRCIIKARKIARRKNISLKHYRKLFCKKCSSYFTSKNSQVRIKKGIKTIKCLKCGGYRRFKLSNAD